MIKNIAKPWHLISKSLFPAHGAVMHDEDYKEILQIIKHRLYNSRASDNETARWWFGGTYVAKFRRCGRFVICASLKSAEEFKGK